VLILSAFPVSITDCQTNSVKKIEMKTRQVLGPQFPSFALTKGVLDRGVQQDCTHKAFHRRFVLDPVPNLNGGGESAQK
jgi:hypothetical protein